MLQITVLIATSMKRSHWLINRCLLSVYNQKEINPEKINILIVDDNKEEKEYNIIKAAVKNKRKAIKLPSTHFKTRIIRNLKTKNNSGTGAWNTGILETYKIYKEGFISILDDDDEYLPNHLSDCISRIEENTLAVFQSLEWKNPDSSTVKFTLNKKIITPAHFFIGNPGIQGSNMFFKTKTLIDIGGFDELLPNTTDRDLMIRFLRHVNTIQGAINSVVVIPSLGVIHYNHNKEKVNNNLNEKQKGLDLFYNKYKNKFSSEAYKQSLQRAVKYFNYQYSK
ncbi:glycosyltransferase family 2 protein [Pontimicrobium sp. MEBiC06410]